MVRNHYDVLGVEQNASAEQIKAAYRRQAKELHPDYYGQESGPFRALQEAYEVLSNPILRRAYDAELARAGRSGRRRPKGGSGRTASEPPISDKPDAWIDPLYSRPRGGWDGPDGPAGDPWAGRSGWDWPDEPDSAPWPDRSDAGVYQASGSDEATIDIELSPAEAERGGQVRVRLPIQVECPVCQGSGIADSLFACAPCGGTGGLITEYYVQVPFPAGLTGTYTSQVSLDQLGLPDASVTVRFNRR